MHDKAFLEELLRNRLYMNTTYTILVSSILMILLSGFGWFAAVKEIKCFLLTYFVLLFLLSIITMVGGVLAYVFREQVCNLFSVRIKFIFRGGNIKLNLQNI